MPSDREGPNEFRVPFIFVPHGHPEPKEWMARHPGWVKFPAVMVPRAELDQQPASPAAAWPPAVPAPMPASLPMQGPVAEVAAVPETPPASELLIDGMAAEAIPPEYRDPQFDVAAFDPIGALRAIQPVLDDPAAAAGLRPPRTAPGPNPGLFTPVQATEREEESRRPFEEFTDPTAELRIAQDNSSIRTLRQLDPTNPQ